jgi:type II secretory pathway component PulF
MRFLFKAVAIGGQIVSDSIDAASRSEAIDAIERRHMKLILLNESSSNDRSHSLKSVWEAMTKERQSANKKLTGEETVMFFSKLQKMIGSGLTLSNSLTSIAKRANSFAEKTFTAALLADISSGISFSESIKKMGSSVSSDICSIIAVGEANGNLAGSIEDVVNLIEAKINLKKRVVSATIYPATMIVFALAVIIGFAFFMMPKLKSLLEQFGADLPPIARILSSGAKLFVISLPLLAVGVTISAVVIANARKTKIGRYKTDQIILKIPPFSKNITLFTKVRFANLMSTLLANGVDMSKALDLAQTSIKNSVILGRFINAKTDILDGEGISKSLEKYGMLEGYKCDLLEVGEKIGNLAGAFKDIHRLYDEELKSRLKHMTSTITAIAMGIVFALVGLLAFTIIQILGKATTSFS